MDANTLRGCGFYEYLDEVWGLSIFNEVDFKMFQNLIYLQLPKLHLSLNHSVQMHDGLYRIKLGIENQYSSNVFFYKLVSDFIHSSVQNGRVYIDRFLRNFSMIMLKIPAVFMP